MLKCRTIKKYTWTNNNNNIFHVVWLWNKRSTQFDTISWYLITVSCFVYQPNVNVNKAYFFLNTSTFVFSLGMPLFQWLATYNICFQKYSYGTLRDNISYLSQFTDYIVTYKVWSVVFYWFRSFEQTFERTHFTCFVSSQKHMLYNLRGRFYKSSVFKLL